MPPGRARKPSDSEAIRALRSAHRADLVEAGQAGVAQFLVGQEGRDDAMHRPAGRQGAVGDDAHQADVSAAVDQGQIALGDGAADRGGGLGEGGVGAAA